MLKPLEQWYCDVCHGVIENPADGFVIWNHDKDFKAYDFKIIHAGKCDIKTYPSSRPLPDFLGPNGVAYLLHHLSHGPIKDNLGQEDSIRIKDMREFIDLFRRVQTPYYEEARLSFGHRELLGEYCDWNEYAPYLPEMLKKVVEYEYGNLL